MKAAIRLANENDALKRLEIYVPIVRETSISFEIEPPSKTEFEGRIQNYQQQMPWLVCKIICLCYSLSDSCRLPMVCRIIRVHQC